jgi:hypothetical protein
VAFQPAAAAGISDVLVVRGSFLTLGADAVQAKRVVGQDEVVATGDFGLQPFNGLVLEFLNLAALDTNHVIVVIASIQLKNRIPAFEMVTNDQTGSFELSEDSIHCGESDFLAFRDETFKYLFRAQVSVRRFAVLQDFKYFESWERDFEARVTNVFSFQGFFSVRCFKLPYGV